MKKYIQLFQFLLLGVFILTSCSNDDALGDFSADEHPLVIHSTVEDMVGKSTQSDNNALSSVGLIITGSLDYPNVEVSGTDDVLQPEGIYWESVLDKISISAYAPYVESIPATFSVKTDQSDLADYQQMNDWWYAAPQDFTYDERDNISITFTHLLSRIEVTLVAGAGVTVDDLSTATIQICETKTEADLDLTSTTPFSKIKAVAAIIPNITDSKYQALILPQTVNKDAELLRITVGDRVFRYLLPATQTYESGKQYKYTATIGLTGISVTLPAEGDIDNWTSQKETYRVGDYYPNDSEPIGVVYQVTDGGKHGKVVSLIEQMNEDESPILNQWSTEEIETKAIDMYNGRINMAEIAELNNWSAYPAFEWVHKLNKSTVDYSRDTVGVWCLPAKNELKCLYAAYSGKVYEDISEEWEEYSPMPGNDFEDAKTARVAFDEKLDSAAGGTGFGRAWYQTSSESSNDSAWVVGFANGNEKSHFPKHATYRVRCVLAF